MGEEKDKKVGSTQWAIMQQTQLSAVQKRMEMRRREQGEIVDDL